MAGSNVPANVVIRINDREVTNSFRGINAEVRRLQRELNGAEVGSEEFTRTFNELQVARRHLESVRTEIQGTTQDLRESSTEIKNFSDLGSFLGDKFSNGLSGANLSFRGLGTTIKTFAVESWAAIGSIPIIGWIAALVAGIGLVVKEVFDFNKELNEANKLASDVTKLQGRELDSITNRSQNLEKLVGFDRQETLEAAKAGVMSFKITYTEAMNEIENGAVRGGRANKEFLNSLTEYAPFLGKAGYSFKEFVAIVNTGYDLSIYKDKLPDALKEFDISMREQTKSTRDALVNAFGATFADDLLKRVSDGKLLMKDALIEIKKESDKYHLSEKQQAQITADIMRGAAEDASGSAMVLMAVTKALVDQNKPLTEAQQILKDQIDSYNELGEAKIDALKSDAILAFQRDLEHLWINIQKGFYNVITILRSVNTYTQTAILTISQYLAVLNVRVMGVFKGMLADLGNVASAFFELGKLAKSAYNLDFEKVDQSFDTIKSKLKSSLSNTKKAFSEFGKESGISFMNNYNKILANDKAKADAQRYVDSLRENASKKTNNFDGTAGNDPNKAKKDAEARAKKLAAENEKLRKEIQKDLEYSENDLEKSEKRKQDLKNQYRSEEIALMKDGLQKELAQADFARAQELQKLSANGEEIQAKILELEKKKLEAKSPVAKANYDKALKEELEARYQNDLLIEKTEQTHQFRLKTIKEKWQASDIEKIVKAGAKKLELSAQQKEQEIQNITSLEDAKYQLQNAQYLKLTGEELRQIDTLEKAKAALRENASRAMLEESRKLAEENLAILEESVKSMTDGPEKEKLMEYIDTLKARILELKGSIQKGGEQDAGKALEDQNKAKSKVDILGFSAKDWEDTFKNTDDISGKLAAMGMIFQALGNAAQMFGDLQRALGERELKNFTKIQKAKKSQLDKNLASGLISQEEYNKRTEAMDIELANKQAEIEYKQAKADKISKLFSAIGATALGVANALSAGPAGIVLAAIVGALGAVQIATIAAQPLPEKPSFADGGFTGKGFGFPDKTGFKQAGFVHENEWVAPEWMTKHPRISKDIKRLEFMRQNGPSSYADGGYTETSSNSTNTTTATASESNDSLRSLFVRLLGIFQRIDDNGGLEAFIVDNPQNQKKVYQMTKKRESLENKNKH